MAIDIKIPDTTPSVAGEQDDNCPDAKPLFGKRPLSRILLHLAIWIPLTAFIIAVAINGKGKPGYEFAMFVYTFISLKMLAQHVSMSQLVYPHVYKLFSCTVGVVPRLIPEKFHVPSLGLAYLAAVLITLFVTPLSDTGSLMQRLQSFLGVFLMVGLLYAMSTNRSAINWRTVFVGFICQFVIALFVLRTRIGTNIFYFLSTFVTVFLGESANGLAFILGPIKDNPFKLTFAVAVLPAILFFCSFIAIVYYLGGMQYLVKKFAFVMVFLMDTSGAESVVAAASPFVGMGESALLVRPFIEFMTRSEIHATMTSGFATIAGSVLLAYINYTGNTPASTSILLTSCLMSVPGSLLVSKIVYPEMEESITKGVVKVPESEDKDVNILDAASKGAAIGVQLVLLVAGSLLAIISLYRACDDLVGWAFNMVNIANWIDPTKPVGIELLLSYVFWPIAFSIGFPVPEARKAAEFMATKIVINEFVAYSNFHDYAFAATAASDGSYLPNGNFSPRSLRLMAFALCGFANIASVGIQVSVLGVIAPSRKKDLAELAISAMLTGALSTWISAAVAGMIL